MNGLKIKINNEEPVYISGVVAVVMVHVNNNDGRSSMSARGINLDMDNVKWIDRSLCLGDKIKVSTIDCNNISPVIETRYRDREELLNEYYQLKKELEEKGLI